MHARTSRLLIGRRAGVIGFTVAGVIAAMVSAPAVSNAGTSTRSRPAVERPRPGPVPHPSTKHAALPTKVRSPLSATPKLATTVSYTYTVDDLVNDTGDANTADGVCDAGSGNCTLRAAIEQANANTGATQINVPSGTITLSTGELYASGDIFITGGVGGGTTTVDAGGNSRVFFIGGGSVEITDLTITGGAAGDGGGVWVDWSALTLSNVTITGNTATSEYFAYGGGIAVGGNGSLWLINSVVSGNDASATTAGYSSHGGGISLSYGAAYIRDTTIGGPTSADGNTAGGSDTYGEGGGIYNDSGSLVAENVTVSNNRSTNYGGGIWTTGSATWNGGAVTGNTADGGTFTGGYGGGVYNGWTLAMTGTTVSNNSARGMDASAGGIYADNTTDLTDVDVTGNTAKFTQSSGSGAVGGGVYADHDLRMLGGSIANNAVTLDESLVLPTDTGYAVGGGLFTSGAASLEGVAITGNSAVTDNNTGEAYGGGVVDDGSLTVTNGSISNNTASGVAVWGGGVFEGYYNNQSLNLSGVQIDGNSITAVAHAVGAAIDAEYYVTLHGVSMGSNAVTVTGNGGEVYGGAVVLNNTATLDHVLIDNTAVQAPDAGRVYGGAVWNNTAATMSHVDIRNTNVSAGYLVEGAGIYAQWGFNMTNSAITGNAGDATGMAISAFSDGGGIFEQSDQGFTVTLVNVTIAGNSMTASGDGDAYDGGIYVQENTQLTNVTLAGNHADTDDGGLYVSGATATFKNTIVAGNTSTGDANCEVSSGGGTLRSTGYNLEDADSCGFHNKGDQINTDPLLGPLQDNGGDTLTMAPDTSPTVSPAIDNATMNGAPKTDQRGVARPQGAGPDIGAVEVIGGEAPAITSANNATFGVGVPGLFTVTTTGDPTPSLSKTAGDLPSGVQFIDNGDGTASIAGTPGSGTAGPYLITITATNGVGADATQEFTLTVVTKLAITTVSLPDGTVGTAYSATLAASGGTGSYTWSVLSGKLPKGLKLSSGGTISGTPHASGSFPFTVLVHDTSSPPMTATANFTISIASRR